MPEEGSSPAAEELPPEPVAESTGEVVTPPSDEEGAAEAANSESVATAALPEPGAARPWRARVEEALDASDADRLRALLAEGGPGSANHGSGQGDGTLLLNLAVQQNSVEMVRALVECGADPERVDADDEECALHVAAGLLGVQPAFALDALRLMLVSSATAALDAVRDGEGRTILHVAVGASKQAAAGAEAQAAAEAAMLAALELLLARGCSVAAADTAGGAGSEAGAGETVLHVAAEWSSPAGLRLLLGSAHASTACLAVDPTGARPLDRALAAGRADNARLLVTQLRKTVGDLALPAAATRALCRMSETAGAHPQRRGARADYGACVRVLIAARAELDRRGKENAKQNSNDQTNDHSRDHSNGRSKVNSKENSAGKGRTPLAAAAVGDTPAPLVAALLRAGARRDVTDSDGRCPLMLAAAHGRDETLAELLSAPARVGGIAPRIAGPGITGPAGRLVARDRRGATALMLAAAAPSPECVAALLAAGAGVGECDGDGRCAILYAVLPALPDLSDQATTPAGTPRLDESEDPGPDTEGGPTPGSRPPAAYSRASRAATPPASLAATGGKAARAATAARRDVVKLLVGAEASLGADPDLGADANSGADADSGADANLGVSTRSRTAGEEARSMPPPDIIADAATAPGAAATTASPARPSHGLGGGGGSGGGRGGVGGGDGGGSILRHRPAGLPCAAGMALACDVDGRCAISVLAGLFSAEDADAFGAVEAALAAMGGGLRAVGGVALASACLDADVVAVRKLLASGISPQPDTTTTPPSLLLRSAAAGVPPDSPLAAAAYAGSVELVQLLLSAGASPKPPPPLVTADAGTAAETAGGVNGGRAGGVNGGGVNGDAAGGEAGWEAGLAAGGRMGHPFSPLSPLRIPRAPLTAASAGGSPSCVLALLAAGAPPDIPGDGGVTPLHAAAASGQTECIEALLEAGADPEIADETGRSALRIAALAGHADALPLLLPPTRAQLDKELDEALVSGELRAAALLAEASGTPSLLWRAIEQQGVDGALLRGLIRQIPRGSLRAQAIEAGGARRTVLHAAVEAGSMSAVVELANMLPEELLLKPSADGLTAIGLAVLKRSDLLAEILERTALSRLRVSVELLHALTAHARSRAREAAEAMVSVWPGLDVKAVACGGPHELAVVWVERWGTSRRSCILAAPSRGAPMPTVEALLLATRKKMEGEGVLAA